MHVAGALPGERVAAVVEHVSRQSRRRLGAAGERRGALTRATAARLPRVRRLRRLPAPAPRLRRAARLEAATRGARARRAPCAGRGADRRLRRLAAAARLPEQIEVGRRTRRGRWTADWLLGAYAPRSHDVVDLGGLPDRRTAARRDGRRAARRSSTRRASAPTTSGRSPATCATSSCAPTTTGRCWRSGSSPGRCLDGVALARRFRAARPEVIGVVEHVNRTRGNAIFSDDERRERAPPGRCRRESKIRSTSRAAPVRLRLAPGAFFQANREVAALAYAAIAGALAIQAHRARGRRLLRRRRASR